MAAKTLILVRHGKAQARSLDVPDGERALTKAGRQALRAWLPKSAALAQGALVDAVRSGGVEIWASPTERTRQTAEETARAYGAAAKAKLPVVEHESLAAQDFAAFCAELAETPVSCVVAVGHNPFIEDELACLCGARLDVATGAVAAVGLPDDPRDWMAAGEAGVPAPAAEDGAADAEGQEEDGAPEGRDAGDGAPSRGATRLLWFVQGPRSQCWKVRNEIEDAVRAWDDAVEERLAAFLAAPDDATALHKLRVSIRTLRSLLAFASPFLRKKACKELQRDLRAVVVETSRLREYDVLLAQTVELPIPSAELAEAVLRARSVERDRVVGVLGGKKTVQALARVRAGVSGLPWRPAVRRAGIEPERARARFDEMARGIDEGFATVDFADADAVHTLRKNAKRVRYAAENFAEVLGEGTRDEAKRMVGVQDRLGAVCDARVNVGIVCEFPTAGLSPEARRALGMLLERNMAFEEKFLRDAARSVEADD